VIFVDTGFIFALASEKDPDHGRVLQAWHGLRGQRLPELLVTTNHVVMECITLTRVRISHQAAVLMGSVSTVRRWCGSTGPARRMRVPSRGRVR